MMTAKEAQKVQRLESENQMLREKLAKSMQIYGDNLVEIIELKATLDLVQSALNRHD